MVVAERMQNIVVDRALMIIAFKPNMRIASVDCPYSEGVKSLIRLRFNTGHVLIAPKLVLNILYLLNGLFTVEQIQAQNFVHTHINSSEVLNQLFSLGIIFESMTDVNNRYIHAKDRLSAYTVHFPIISNVNVMISVILRNFGAKAIFYTDGTITNNDVSKNIYYSFDDVGKNILKFICHEMKIDTVSFEESGFNIDFLNANTDIIVNSDERYCINDENFIIINTWNYQKIRFDDFRLFNGKIDASDDLKSLVMEYVLAIRSVDDILYSINGNLVS